MVRVWAELGAGKITEAYIVDREGRARVFTHGVMDEGSKHITINPVHAVVDTVIHEILHRLEPEWDENYVRRTTSFLRTRMTDGETQAFYDEYQRRKRRRKRPKDLTET
jgi:hypothetical protein